MSKRGTYAYREGARLLHQALVVNQKSPAKLAQVMEMLGTTYYDLLQDAMK